jgi:hypothetical protein
MMKNWTVEGSTQHERRESVPMFQAAQFVGIMREFSVRDYVDRTAGEETNDDLAEVEQWLRKRGAP